MVVAIALLALFQWGLPMEDTSRTETLGLEISVAEEGTEGRTRGTPREEGLKRLEQFIEQSSKTTGIAPGIIRARLDPSRLNGKYPLGYVVFASNGAVVQSYRPNEKMVSITPLLEVPILHPDVVILTTPDITFHGLNIRYSANKVRLPRKEGARDAFGATDDVLLWAEILANSDSGVVWVLGLRRESMWVALPKHAYRVEALAFR
jgi:hypothetical protein